MILLFTILLLPSFADGHFVNSLRPHLSVLLRLKCDSLPYRTAFVGNKCYFADTKEVKLDLATAQCSSILPGAKVETDVPGIIFSKMMLEKSRFHFGKDSTGASIKLSGAKQSICVLDSGYKCATGEQSPVILGKCINSSPIKRNFFGAEKLCQRWGMELPTIENELENQMIRTAIPNDFAWIRHVYDGRIYKWTRVKYYAKYSHCHRAGILYAGHDMVKGNWPFMSSVIDKQGLHGFHQWNMALYGTVCVKDAENAFTRRGECAPYHRWDTETGQCEWTGPKDACLQAIETNSNASMFVTLPNFPKETHIQFELPGRFSDTVSKVVVRRGCMYTGFASHIWYAPRSDEIMAGNANLLYGEHPVPCWHTGDLPSPPDSMNRLDCMCDPTDATVNFHVPEPPPNKKCIKHHVFDEKTQQCEWIHEAKYCAEISTHDGRKQMLEIPNWPTTKRYDVKHFTDKKDENFHLTVTEIIIRQHCWATLYRGNTLNDKKSLPTSGYGRYQVASYQNGLLNSNTEGTYRIVCECMR